MNAPINSAILAASTAPGTIEGAGLVGVMQANEWLLNRENDPHVPASSAAWRARCYADSVHEYEGRADFLQMLAAWEQGFDATLRVDVQATPAAHQPFSWLGDELKDHDSADFVALTMDVCFGIETCLELVHSSGLERAFNRDADPGQESAPALDLGCTERLLRLAIVSSRLLSASAEQRINWLSSRAKKAAA